MSNLYYDPEDFGLEIVYEYEFSRHPYEFDTRVVWRDIKTGVMYTARDSGCSCPTPFEEYTGVEQLDRVLEGADFRTLDPEQDYRDSLRFT